MFRLPSLVHPAVLLGLLCGPTGTSGQAPRPEAGTLLLRPDAAWYLKGGLISAGLVPPGARSAWPPWMRALCGGGGGRPGELAEADLSRVPDLFLVDAVRRLREAGLFTPRLLSQVTAIGYAADTRGWVKARTAYQTAYLSARGLAGLDAGGAGRVLTQLTMEGQAEAARRILASPEGPLDADTRLAWTRLLDLQEGRAVPGPGWIEDPRRAPAERFLAWRRLKGSPARRVQHLAGLRDTPFFDVAVHHAVTQGWLPLADPRVEAAIRAAVPGVSQDPWFLVRAGERGSDLLWMRTAEALDRQDRDVAVQTARQILERFPRSFYAAHAHHLLRGWGLTPPGLPQRLRIPGDVTFCNAAALAEGMAPPPGPWPEPLRALAESGRFDLILARVDPEREADLFLRAAQAAGQMDLVARHVAIRQDLGLGNLRYLYPILPAPVLARLIREEGGEDLLDPAFLLAVIKNESQFQPSATSGAQAMGLMQLLRGTFQAMAGRHADIRDPETNLRAGIRYLLRVARTADLRDEPAPVRMAYMVAGYHAGEGRARRWHAEIRARLGKRTDPAAMLLRTEGVPFVSTRQYILRVLGDREIFLKCLAV